MLEFGRKVPMFTLYSIFLGINKRFSKFSCYKCQNFGNALCSSTSPDLSVSFSVLMPCNAYQVLLSFPGSVVCGEAISGWLQVICMPCGLATTPTQERKSLAWINT